MCYSVLHLRDFPKPLSSRVDAFYRLTKLEEAKLQYQNATSGKRRQVRQYVFDHENGFREDPLISELAEFIRTAEQFES